jgi:hypothetical protein
MASFKGKKVGTWHFTNSGQASGAGKRFTVTGVAKEQIVRNAKPRTKEK